MRGKFGADVGGADLLEAFVHDALGKFREIALATEVTEVQVAQIGGHDSLGGIGGIGI